jgi:hypothetical protein
MNIKLYIGSELADFNEVFNVMFSVGDIREPSFGNSNKSYTLNLPLTRQNKKLLKFISQADVKSEVSAIGRLYIGELLIIEGFIVVLEYSDYTAKIIINSDDWIEEIKDVKLLTLDMSASDHTLTHANVQDSWSASFPMYRYPMIDFGALQSGQVGASAVWYPTDFIPMISVAQLIAKILEPYTISSTWIDTTFVKNIFILGREMTIDESFIRGKNLLVAVTNDSDNLATGTSSTVMMVTLHKILVFNTKTTDEGDDWTGTAYTVPATGTYRFKAAITFVNTAYGNSSLTIEDEQVVIDIVQNSAIIATIASAAYVATELINGVTYTVDSGYVNLTVGDSIEIDCLARCYVTGISGTQTVTINTTTASNLINIWSTANLSRGLNSTVSLEEMLPDMTQLDFLAAIRDIFNLRFWMDKQKRTIYIEPWDSFISDHVIDLTSFVDFESVNAELISPNYSKNIVLKFKNDDSDEAYKEYLKANVNAPGRKEITLTSLYTKEGIEEREHPFSTVIPGYNQTLGNYTLTMPRIWKEIPAIPFNMYDRKVGFNTRLVEWKGLTSGLTWYYDADTLTQYPKIEGLDFATLYTSYWQKFYHYIDKGKLYTVKIKLNPLYLAQFHTVIADAESEGFRPTYSITINSIKNYFFLQKITTDGEKADIELILK